MSQLIPEGWALAKLEELISYEGVISDGDWVESKDQDPEGSIRLIQLADIGDGEFLNKSNRFMNVASAQMLNCTYLKENDVLIARMPDPLGRACMFPKIENEAVTVVDVCLIRLDDRAGISPKVLMHWINSSVIRNIIALEATGTTRKRITRKKLSHFDFPLPPLAEQKVIADKLDELLAQVESTKARLDAIPTILKSFRQSVLTAAVSGKLTEEWRQNNTSFVASLSEIQAYWAKHYQILGKRFKNADVSPIQDIPMEIPDNWIWSQIGLVFDVYVGATPSRKEERYWGGDINWVSSSEVAFCRISETKETITNEGLNCTSTNVHPKGTVMLAMIGQGKTRGQPAILDIDACHNQNTAAIRIPEKYCISEYLYYFLYERYEETRRVGSGNNQQAMNKSVVQSLSFPLPPYEEQVQIVRRVEELFTFADKVEAQVNASQTRVNNLTQSILAKAFRGELTADWRAANPELISGENSAEALLEKIKVERKSMQGKKTRKKA